MSGGGSWTEQWRTVNKDCWKWNLLGSWHVWRTFCFCEIEEIISVFELLKSVGFESVLAHAFVSHGNQPVWLHINPSVAETTTSLAPGRVLKKGNRRQFQRQKTRETMVLLFKYFTKENDSQFLFIGGSTVLFLILIMKIMIFFSTWNKT